MEVTNITMEHPTSTASFYIIELNIRTIYSIYVILVKLYANIEMSVVKRWNKNIDLL